MRIDRLKGFVQQFGDVEPGTPALLVAATIGCIAGMFTDQVLASLKRILKISDPTKPGTTMNPYK